MIPALAPGWVAQPVTFEAGGVTIYGTYTHPGSAPAGTLPAALLLGGSGSWTDRNDNNPAQPHGNALEAVANWLSADGVASLRYDKLGSGQTGWGRDAAHPERAGLGTYEQEAVAALRFLAGQRQVDRARLAVFGHSEGGVYALLLASGLAGPAPRVRAVGLLEPVPIRFLDLIEQSSVAALTCEVQQGQITAAQAQNLEQALARAIASLRRTGTLPSGLPDGLAGTFTGSGTLLELSQMTATTPPRSPSSSPRTQRCCSPAATPTTSSDAPRWTTSPQACRKPRRGSTTCTSTGSTTSSRRTSPRTRRHTTSRFRSPPSCAPR